MLCMVLVPQSMYKVVQKKNGLTMHEAALTTQSRNGAMLSVEIERGGGGAEGGEVA